MSNHTESLLQLAAKITDLLRGIDGVKAIWIGGSLGREGGDELSDIDLRVAIAADRPDLVREIRLPQDGSLPKIVHEDQLALGPNMLLRHSLFEDGDIVDLCVLSASEPISEEPRIVLFCNDAELAQKLKLAPIESTEKPRYSRPGSDTVATLVRQAILINIKHARVVHRALILLAHTGIHLERMSLVRLLYIKATGADCGALDKVGISLATSIIASVQQAQGGRLISVFGAPLRTKKEVESAVQLLHEETVRCGRALAQQFGFLFPEEMVAARDAVWRRYHALQQEVFGASMVLS